ncbi:MAG: hypothetical protein K9L26_02115 [Candidatus Izimaplasma sp.]|nr:hypothetical protein [Candidatus Izimaplasma bacterium]
MQKPKMSTALSRAFGYFVPIVILYSVLLLLSELDTNLKVFLTQLANIVEIALAPLLAMLIGYFLDGKKSLIINLLIGSLAGFFQTTFLGGLLVGLATHLVFHYCLHKQTPYRYLLFIGMIVLEGILFYFLIIPGITLLLEALSIFLSNIAQTGIILLVMTLGGLTAVDLGGPFNKAAFTFTVTAFLEGNYHITGPVLLTTGIPPLTMGIVHLYYRSFKHIDTFVSPIRSILLGIIGITEGALPYAAQKPFPVIISGVVGSASAAMIGGLLHIENKLLISSFLGIIGVNNVVYLIVSIACGVLIAVLVFHLVDKLITKES